MTAPAPTGPAEVGTAPQAAAPPTADGQATRGGLDITDRAVERLVVAAAREVDDVAAPVSRVLGQSLGGADLEGDVKATVKVAGEIATVDLSLSVRWPAPVVDVADRVRDRVTTRLRDLAGLRVGYVDVEVTALTVDHRPLRRRVE